MSDFSRVGGTVHAETVLEVRNLATHFFTPEGTIKAVDDVSFSVKRRETLGIVGESGCGKSVTALSVIRLVPDPPGRIVDGEIYLNGRDILRVGDDEMSRVRGREVGMVFQEPMTSLNPLLTVGRQLTEGLRWHFGMSGKNAWRRAGELLEMVGIPDPYERLNDYPHQMSGGQRQRVMIAIALSCEPQLLIADEATTALDVTIQAQILELLMRLSDEFGTATIIITHNLGVVARYADRVNVMYAGRLRETGSADAIYGQPSHPYTVGLLQSVPRLDRPRGKRLESIEGEIPNLTELSDGCAFAPRCGWVQERCREQDPPLLRVSDVQSSACFEWETVRAR